MEQYTGLSQYPKVVIPKKYILMRIKTKKEIDLITKRERLVRDHAAERDEEIRLADLNIDVFRYDDYSDVEKILEHLSQLVIAKRRPQLPPIAEFKPFES